MATTISFLSLANASAKKILLFEAFHVWLLKIFTRE